MTLEHSISHESSVDGGLQQKMPLLVADLLPQAASAWQLGAGGQALDGLAEGQLGDGLAKSPAEGRGNGSGKDQDAEVDHAVDGQFSIEFADADVDADATAD